ncbi:uncharacterized protein L969DRAFT_86868 [Mixia osmundae IAM 14324]|uniref:uncharacterized protein n=1 Tax=Mixia osmundae (strain CBS 9802 / IAM 14324 / JCM 22182 / KY 12970) TaxID=764103 RepID=UPI0004A54963|nr:uncharacterized protein L969DRAFT_86868 [Mixia osmundae IAM 14324]KEI40236.1 hypothetical protein L969DRAFT_86868 [Mixia osmundae IAM 14324]
MQTSNALVRHESLPGDALGVSQVSASASNNCSFGLLLQHFPTRSKYFQAKASWLAILVSFASDSMSCRINKAGSQLETQQMADGHYFFLGTD